MDDNFFIRTLTPSDTEEVRPNLFVQKRGDNKYRVVYPSAWNGKINWTNLLLGANFGKNLVWFVIILFLAFSYRHDNQQCFDLMQKWNDGGLVCADRSAFTAHADGGTYLKFNSTYNFSTSVNQTQTLSP